MKLWARLDGWYRAHHRDTGFAARWNEAIDDLYRAARDVFGEVRSLGDWDDRHTEDETERLCAATGRWLWP